MGQNGLLEDDERVYVDAISYCKGQVHREAVFHRPTRGWRSVQASERQKIYELLAQEVHCRVFMHCIERLGVFIKQITPVEEYTSIYKENDLFQSVPCSKLCDIDHCERSSDDP